MPPSRLLAIPFYAMAAPALANDSSAAIGLGGLALTRSDAISMDSEDLYISQAEVRVRYRFTNHSARDIETLVSFPVPDLPEGLGDGYLGDRSLPDWRELEFRTTIDGRPVQLEYLERAMVGTRDVTARLTALGWPAGWSIDDIEQDGLPFLNGLSEAQQTAHIREGLLRRSKDLGVVPAWNLVTHVTRKQVFPAGKTVEVAHRYVPLAGGSVGGGLDPEWRRDENFAAKARHYCLDRAFLTGFDRRLGTRPMGERPFYMEHWLRYILSSGANWRGPIDEFRLVVDKGTADNLVSFCLDGVKKISPTQFEVVKRNFEPKRDIDVLIVSWGMPD